MVWQGPVGVRPVLAISGPTGSGKSDLAIFLAQKLEGEIVNIDSVQVYRYFDIGSAKPSLKERSLVPHHLYDIADPNEPLNASKYGQIARAAIASIQSRDKLPILVGGSSMYFTTLFHGLAAMPGKDPQLRAALEKLIDEELHARLNRVDPERAAKLHLHDRLRVIRAIESFELSGLKQSESFENHGFKKQVLSALILVPIWPRRMLYERIDRRSAQMIELGLIEEVRGIVSKFGKEIQPLASLGYSQVSTGLEQAKPDQGMVEEIAMQTRRFAKRQMTFWRNEPAKRGWRTLPVQDPLAEASSTGRRGKSVLVEIKTMKMGKDELLKKVRARMGEPVEVSEVWYIDAQKLAGEG